MMLRQIHDATKLAEESAKENSGSNEFSFIRAIGIGLLLGFLAATIAHCQRNEISISAVGNFNPTSYILIQNTPHEVISSNCNQSCNVTLGIFSGVQK